MNDLKGIIEDCNKSDLVSKKVIKKVIEIIGQEEWNDLHDEQSDICTTMGELIITLEGIPDLEKENAELKAYNEKLLDGDIEKHNKIVELKVKYDTCLRENTGLKIHSAYVEKKLTEAKEIIRELLFTSNELDENTRSKAEQFLKENN